MMLATLLARVSPASTSAKPACMKMTSTAASRTKTLSRFVWTSAASISWAPAGPASTRTAPVATPGSDEQLAPPRRPRGVGGWCMHGCGCLLRVGCRETGRTSSGCRAGPAGGLRARARRSARACPALRGAHARQGRGSRRRIRLDHGSRRRGARRPHSVEVDRGGRARRGGASRQARAGGPRRGAGGRAAAPEGAGRRRSGRPSTAPGRRSTAVSTSADRAMMSRDDVDRRGGHAAAGACRGWRRHHRPALGRADADLRAVVGPEQEAGHEADEEADARTGRPCASARPPPRSVRTRSCSTPRWRWTVGADRFPQVPRPLRAMHRNLSRSCITGLRP